MKLNQLVAIISGEKTKAQKAITELYKKLQHPELMNGIIRKYEPKDDDGDKFPEEKNKIKFSALETLSEAEKIYGTLWDLIYSQDVANCSATANVQVDNLYIEDIPVTNLMFLEKQLTDLHTLISKIPELDPSEDWFYNQLTDAYETHPVQTVKTKKIPKNHVKAEATKEHPAQVELFTEDAVIGYWKTVKLSACLPHKNKTEMLERLNKLRNAIKIAREEANCLQVDKLEISKDIFNYIVGPESVFQKI